MQENPVLPMLAPKPEGERLNVISLGAGVQSSTMALMAARGDLTPMPDAAIFADTQAEPRRVYEWLDWLETQLPFPVYRVTQGSLRDAMMAMRNSTGERYISIPFFTRKGKFAKVGRIRRQCTKEFKVEPIERGVRQLLGLRPRQHGPRHIAVDQWIGISLDEAVRMKPARKRYIHHRFPLIEAKMTRADCLLWMERRQYPEPAKSSCTFCPYHSNAYWRDMKLNDPESWDDAVGVDKALRDGEERWRFQHELYLHRSGQPLEEVDLRNAEDLGQLDMFNNECEGLCGV